MQSGSGEWEWRVGEKDEVRSGEWESEEGGRERWRKVREDGEGGW